MDEKLKTIYIRLTDKCNLKCKHCYSENSDSFILLDNDIVDFINNIDKANIVLHGGEPMLYDINKLNDFVKKMKHNVSITTNLSYIIDDNIKEFFSKTKVSTSWDPFRFNNEQYNLWLNNLKEIENISIICTLTKELLNIDPIKMSDLIASWGNPLVQFGMYDGDNKPTRTDIYSWFNKLTNTNNNCFIEQCAKSCIENVFTINTDKTIAGCPNRYKIIYGTIFDSWDRITNSKNMIMQWSKETYVKSKIGNYCFLQGCEF